MPELPLAITKDKEGKVPSNALSGLDVIDPMSLITMLIWRYGYYSSVARDAPEMSVISLN